MNTDYVLTLLYRKLVEDEKPPMIRRDPYIVSLMKIGHVEAVAYIRIDDKPPLELTVVGTLSDIITKTMDTIARAYNPSTAIQHASNTLEIIAHLMKQINE